MNSASGNFPFPPVIRIEPSASCNLECRHCPTGTIDMARGIMRPELFEKVLKEVAALKDQVRTVVLYHGGEPLLNKHFPDMARAIKNAGIANVKTVSNGMLLKPERMDALIDSGIDSIEFSLDGRSIEENNFIRRKSDFSTVVTNIKAFLDRLIERKLEKPKVFVSNSQILPRDNPELCATNPNPPEYLVQEFGGKYASMVEFKCVWAMEWPHIGDEIHDLFDLWVNPKITTFQKRCSYVEETITVRSGGEIVACCYDLTSKQVLGNIKDQTLEEIWNGAKYRGLRTSIAKGVYPGICKNCNTVRPPVYLLYKPDAEKRFNAHA